MRGTFLPSMIEVEFGDYYKRCAALLFNGGFNSFHIDFGDEKLINRELECWDKVDFLKTLGKDLKLTAHIMSMSGSHRLSVENITEKFLDKGFEIIYIHARVFKDFNKLVKFKENLFKGAHNIFGIVSELEKNKNLIDFAKDISLNNLLQMGVPIGKGGQKFNWSATERIKDFSLECSTLSNIELDGGITFDVLKKLKKDRIDRFAGWSIVSDPDPKNVLSKSMEVKLLI